MNVFPQFIITLSLLLQLSAFASLANSTEFIALCDSLAAHPDDATKPATLAGVEDKQVNAKEAYQACAQAWQQAPKNARIIFQVARAEYLYLTQSYGEAWFKGRARYWIKFEVAYKNGSQIAGEYFKNLAPQAYAQINKEIALRNAIASADNKTAQKGQNCELENGRLFTESEVANYINNAFSEGLTLSDDAKISTFRHDFAAIEGRTNAASYTLYSRGKIYTGTAYIPSSLNSVQNANEKDAHFCTFFSEPVATRTKCFQIIALPEKCQYNHALFDKQSGTISSLSKPSNDLDSAPALSQIQQREYDLREYFDFEEQRLGNPSDYSKIFDLIDSIDKDLPRASIRYPLAKMHNYGQPKAYVDIDTAIANLDSKGKYKDMPAGLYLSAIYEGNFDVLKALDKKAGGDYSKHMNAYGTEALANFTALFSGQVSKKDELANVFQAMISEYSLVGPAMATYVLSFGELYSTCLGESPVTKKVVNEFQDMMSDGYGFEVPIGPVTRTESTYSVKSELGDILFKYSDLEALAIAGIADKIFNTQEQLNILDINKGVIKLMENTNCNSAQATQFEMNLLRHWYSHQSKVQLSERKLKQVLTKP